MIDNISPEQYRAELSYMNHEIAQLREEAQRRDTLNKYNPFDNPTEYPDYSGDYSKILPQVTEQGCKIPISPNGKEKKAIRKYYNIAGLCVILSSIASTLIMLIFIAISNGILKFSNPDADYSIISAYESSTSISMALNLITFLICNCGFAFLGLSIAKIKPSELIRIHDFTAVNAVQYCFIGLFLQSVAGYISLGISDIVEHYGYTVYSVDDAFESNFLTGKLVTIVYACIVAPITEELFYRGMLLKLFSKANQRFGIIITAIFFGLGHGNIAQFALGFIAGIFLAHITQKHNSIIPSILCHMTINTFSTIVTEFSTDGYSTANMIINFLYIIITLAGLVMFIEFRLKNKLPATTPQQSRRGFAVAVTSIPTVIAAAGFMGMMIFNIVMVS